ncbi:hypothetical protein [Fluviicola sp.]|uniref:DUF7822 domain-containing protein n=1 Tax=Fluviicola sp. TaxID=1917219 RepID=UPI0031D5DAA5
MANRSYIYALNGDKHISLGEFNYFIPYAYRILAAFDNKIVDSHLFDKVVGIEADFKQGREALYQFLDLLAATNQMKDHEEFVEAVAKTREYLDPIDADTTLLENGEIYALYTNNDGEYLDGPGLERANEHAGQDYQWIGEDVQNLINMNLDPAKIFHYTDESYLELFQWMIDLKDNWKEKLGIDSWRSVLYFQFNSKEN